MYNKYTLENGIQVVTEKIPHFRSVSIGLWFRVGSIHEQKTENGLSHFIEHMLFKGTETRTAKQIAETMDAVGGQLNAFTAKECTCFYCKVIDEHLDLALNLLADMTLKSVFDPIEIKKEKGVILEEILMYEDSPEDMAQDLLAKAFFGAHPLGQPIIGSPENLEGFNREQIISFFQSYYTPNNLVISVAGNFEDDNLISLLKQYFGGWKRNNAKLEASTEPKSKKRVLYKNKDIEQVHLCIGCPGIKMGDEKVYSLLTFNNLFGGGMSSRLFQKIREEHGLAYSVFSYPSSYAVGGLFTVYAGMKPAQLKEVASLIRDEIDKVKKGITESELVMAREQLKGNYILGLESTSSRMTAIGKAQLLLGKTRTPSEVLEKIDRVGMEEIFELLDVIFNPSEIAIAIVARDDQSNELEEIFCSK